MPFWRSKDDRRQPAIRLVHLGGKLFELEDGFVYKVLGQPTVIPVPGGAQTDLASVPWRLWWLVASYGRHTRASLLHDALIDPGSPIPRVEADEIFFDALEETRRRLGGSKTRNWLIWLAVSVFGTMREQARGRFRLFIANVVGFWLIVGLVVAGGVPFLVDIDRTALAVVAGGVFALGFAWIWTAGVPSRLAYRLWPMAVFWLAVLVPALAFVELAVRLVQLADIPTGGGRTGPWTAPKPKPFGRSWAIQQTALPDSD